MLRFRWRSPIHRATMTVIFGLVALVAGAIAAVQAVDEFRFEGRAHRLDGVVVGLKMIRRVHGVSYVPIFRFAPPGAPTRDLAAHAGANPPAWAIGDRSVVLFDPATPDYVAADTLGQRWGLPLGFGLGSLFSVFFFVIALRP